MLTCKTNSFEDCYVKFVPQPACPAAMSSDKGHFRSKKICLIMSNLNVFVFVASLGFLWYPMITVDHGGKGATMQLSYLKRWFSFREMLNLRRDSSWFICSIMILTPTLEFIWGRTRVQNEHLPSNALNCWFTVPCWRSNSAAASATLGKSNKKVAGNCRPAQSPSLLAILEVSFCDHSDPSLKRTWNGKDLKHRNNDMKRMFMIWYEMKRVTFHPVHSPRKEVWGFSCDREASKISNPNRAINISG